MDRELVVVVLSSRDCGVRPWEGKGSGRGTK